MKTFLLSVGVIAMSGSVWAASADTMAAYYGNTLNVANSEGVITKFFYNPDHTYVMRRPGAADSATHRPNTPDAEIKGTWEQRGDQICQAPSLPGGVFICYPAKARKVGEEWHTGPDKLFISAGR